MIRCLNELLFNNTVKWIRTQISSWPPKQLKPLSLNSLHLQLLPQHQQPLGNSRNSRRQCWRTRIKRSLLASIPNSAFSSRNLSLTIQSNLTSWKSSKQRTRQISNRLKSTTSLVIGGTGERSLAMMMTQSSVLSALDGPMMRLIQTGATLSGW